MSESGTKGAETSNELLRWLRMLILPAWARAGILLLVFGIIAGAAVLVGQAIVSHEPEQAASAITLLTVALPVFLVVIALVFGQNSDRTLRSLTQAVLERHIPYLSFFVRGVLDANSAARARKEALA